MGTFRRSVKVVPAITIVLTATALLLNALANGQGPSRKDGQTSTSKSKKPVARPVSMNRAYALAAAPKQPRDVALSLIVAPHDRLEAGSLHVRAMVCLDGPDIGDRKARLTFWGLTATNKLNKLNTKIRDVTVKMSTGTKRVHAGHSDELDDEIKNPGWVFIVAQRNGVRVGRMVTVIPKPGGLQFDQIKDVPILVQPTPDNVLPASVGLRGRDVMSAGQVTVVMDTPDRTSTETIHVNFFEAQNGGFIDSKTGMIPNGDSSIVIDIPDSVLQTPGDYIVVAYNEDHPNDGQAATLLTIAGP